MGEILCVVCQSRFGSEKEFNKHLRGHKLKIEDYYLTYYNKKDLFTQEVIPFKNREQYLSSNFLNKGNLKLWFTSSDLQTKIKFIENFILDRINRKNLIFFPSQVELRSLMCPSLLTVSKEIPNYKNIFTNLGLIEKTISQPPKPNFIDITNPILIDTREQTPLFFRKELTKKVAQLNYGDYKLERDLLDQKLVIERKSLPDFVSTLSTGFDRFSREIERATNDNSYIVVLIESSLKNALNFKRLNLVSPKIAITEDYVFHNVRQLLQTYKNIQFLFSENRDESSRLVEKILYAGNLHLKYDLQMEYDLKEL